MLEAVQFLKDAFEKGRPLSQHPAWALPLRFVPDTAKRYLYAPGVGGHRRLLADRYEFLVYRYPQSSEPVNHSFFDGLKQVDIGSVLHFVNRHCPFMEAFDHVLGHYTKQAADDRTIIACLVAWGTNMGFGRMGDISDIGYNALSTTSDNFVRLETLREANDLVSNATSELPMFRYYDID